MKLLLIGAGQLGSRHLQSCLKYSQSLDVYVVDNSENSLQIAKERAFEIDINGRHTIKYLTNIKSIKETFFDFLIIATGASVRYQILQEVLALFSFKYAILEKVLFQDIKSYSGASQLIVNHGVRVFVNCPLRTYPFFRLVKDKYISKTSRTQLKYTGGEWVGLACNSIHYLDLLNYLTDEVLENFDVKKLDDGYISSKRDRCVEFTGKVEGSYSSGSKILIDVMRDSVEDSTIEITNGLFRIVIDELSGKYQIFEQGRLVKDSSYDIVYQSDLTHKMIEQLVLHGTCELISFDDSIKIHEEFITKLLQHYNKYFDFEVQALPIT